MTTIATNLTSSKPNEIQNAQATEVRESLINSRKTSDLETFLGNARSYSNLLKPLSNSNLGLLSKGANFASKLLGGIGGVFSGIELFSNFGARNPLAGLMNGTSFGATLGSIVPGVGNAIGAVVGGITGLMSGMFKSGKHQDQVARDQVRSMFQNLEIIDKDFKLNLRENISFDIGKDGDNTLTNIDGTKRRYYEVDFGNELSHQAIGWVQPLVSVLVGNNEKLRSDFTGYFVNAVTSGAKDIEEVRDNILALYEKVGSPDDIASAVVETYKSGSMTEHEVEAFMGGIITLFDEDKAYA